MRYFLAIIICFLTIISLTAQNFNNQTISNVGLQDTTLFEITPEPVLDSTLVGTSVFELADSTNFSTLGKSNINQPLYMEDAFNRFVDSNSKNTQHGYRIRVFFSNTQDARGESEELEKEFKENFPLIPTYRSYTTPYFKIVVGDYRTKSDAMHVYDSIKSVFPNAIIVKDYIGFPALD